MVSMAPWLWRGSLSLTLAFGLLVSGCATKAPPPSAEGRGRCERLTRDRPALLRPLATWQCLGRIETQLAAERRLRLQQEQQQRQRSGRLAEQQRQCLRKRPLLSAALAELRQAELALAQTRDAIAAGPLLPPPPPPLDEAQLSRYTREDAELDRQRHAEALASWQQQRAARRQAWRQLRQQQEAAQARLDRAAGELRRLQPDLLARGIELDPAVERRVFGCQAEPPQTSSSDRAAARMAAASP